MMRTHKALLIGFFSLALLVGCGNNEPSNSDIENQLTSPLPSCSELSITNFQKLNGYPQTDGSYIDQVQYNVTYTPTDAISDAINAYYPQLVQLSKEMQKDSQQINDISEYNAVSQSLYQDYDAASKKFNDLKIKMNDQLSIAVGRNCSASDLIGIFSNAAGAMILTKTQSITMNQTLHLIKSDNGWVIQN